MKSIIPFYIFFTFILLQSCSMGRHYANVRIDHDNDEIMHANPVKPNLNINKNRPSSFIATADSSLAETPVTDEKKSVTGSESLEKKTVTAQHVKSQKENRKTYYVHVKKKTIFTAHKIKRKIRKNKLSATKTVDDLVTHALVIALLLGVVAAIVSGSIGVGFLVALGIVLLVLLGLAIAIGAIIWFVFELLLVTFWK